MYSLINKHIDRLLTEGFRPEYLPEYFNLLVENPEKVRTNEYQRTYVTTWKLGRLGFDDRHWGEYFNRMYNLLQNPPSNSEAWLKELHDLASSLYQIKTKRLRNVLPFSACTKLAHIVNNHLPIYDSKVAAFYLWSPTAARAFERRIMDHLEFYNKLLLEYAKVIQTGLLNEAIEEFRRRFYSRVCTDERILDFLIWSWVGFCRRQGVSGRRNISQIGHVRRETERDLRRNACSHSEYRS